jgi:hypothetical protein
MKNREFVVVPVKLLSQSHHRSCSYTPVSLQVPEAVPVCPVVLIVDTNVHEARISARDHGSVIVTDATE